jgi:hypothetical protein
VNDIRSATNRTGGSGRPGGSGAGEAAGAPVTGEQAVVVRTQDGWRVGGVDVPDLTSAMVLADLLAAELAAAETPTGPISVDAVRAASDEAERAAGPGGPAGDPPGGRQRRAGRAAAQSPADGDLAGLGAAISDPNKLRATIGQLEHALTARVRVEQAIGVLAERHRIQPRQAFEQLRAAARNRGKRVIDVAGDVVASATNPLLQLPDELSRPRSPGRRGRAGRRALGSE